MKKLLCILFAVFLMMTLAACGDAAGSNPEKIRPAYEGTEVRLEYEYANLSVVVPEGWEYHKPDTEKYGASNVIALELYPAEAPEILVRVGCFVGAYGTCGTGKTFEDLDFGEDAGSVIKSTEILGETRSVMITWEDKPPMYYAAYDIPEASAAEWEPKILEILSSAIMAEGALSRADAEAAAAKAFGEEYQQIGATDYDHDKGDWHIGIQYTCTGDPEWIRYTVHADGTAEEAHPNEITYDKPVIYLYPEEKTDITVRLPKTDLTVTYPAYNDGWSVTASPDGTLINHADGREYSYLFWEGDGPLDADFSEGFCVRGEDTAAFLQETLSALGLTPREYNEFIVWWLPQMQDNAYNLINFVREEYDTAAPLEITPAPDTLLRVFMVWQASENFVEIPAPNLPAAPERNGFTVIEWGGTEIEK